MGVRWKVLAGIFGEDRYGLRCRIGGVLSFFSMLELRKGSLLENRLCTFLLGLWVGL